MQPRRPRQRGGATQEDHLTEAAQRTIGLGQHGVGDAGARGEQDRCLSGHGQRSGHERIGEVVSEGDDHRPGLPSAEGGLRRDDRGLHPVATGQAGDPVGAGRGAERHRHELPVRGGDFGQRVGGATGAVVDEPCEDLDLFGGRQAICGDRGAVLAGSELRVARAHQGR